MSIARLCGVGPLLVVLPSCGATLRTGPKFTVTHGEPALQQEGTVAAGPSSTDGDALGQFAYPVTIAAGSTLDHRTALVHLESGVEWSTVPRDSPWGYRVGARL